MSERRVSSSGAVPVTVTVSSTCASDSPWFMTIVCWIVRITPMVSTVWKPVSMAVTVYVPGESAGRR